MLMMDNWHIKSLLAVLSLFPCFPGQLSFLLSAEQEMSTNQSGDACYWGVKASIHGVRVT